MTLRTASGRPPAFQNGTYFSLDQGELHDHPDYHRLWCGIDWSVGVLPLNNGKWLARPTREPNSYTVRSHQFDSREAALRVAIATVIRRARIRARWDGRKYYAHAGRDLTPAGWKLTVEQAQSIINWSRSLLRKPPQHLFMWPVAEAATAMPERGQLEMFR